MRVKKHHKEHVNEYILENNAKFKTENLVKLKLNYKFSYTVDTKLDYLKMSKNFLKHKYNLEKHERFKMIVFSIEASLKENGTFIRSMRLSKVLKFKNIIFLINNHKKSIEILKENK